MKRIEEVKNHKIVYETDWPAARIELGTGAALLSREILNGKFISMNQLA